MISQLQDQMTIQDSRSIKSNADRIEERLEKFMEHEVSIAVRKGYAVRGKKFDFRTEDGILLKDHTALIRHMKTGAPYPEGPAEKWANEAPGIEAWVVVEKGRHDPEDALPIVRVVIAIDVPDYDANGNLNGLFLFRDGDEIQLTDNEALAAEEQYWEERADKARAFLED